MSGARATFAHAHTRKEIVVTYDVPEICIEGIAYSKDNFVRLGFVHNNLTVTEALTRDMAEELYAKLEELLWP